MTAYVMLTVSYLVNSSSLAQSYDLDLRTPRIGLDTKMRQNILACARWGYAEGLKNVLLTQRIPSRNRKVDVAAICLTS